MPTSVLCPIGATERSERAIASAWDASSSLGAQLVLFTAVEDPHMEGRAEQRLQQLAERYLNGAKVGIEVVTDPHPPRAITDRASHPETLVVMATSTQPLMHRGYLGSAAERTVLGAAGPVMLVGPNADIRLQDVTRVVTPCDGSALSHSILDDAHDWSSLLGVPLWIVTAIGPGERRQPGFDKATETNYVRRVAMDHDAQWDVLCGSSTARTIADWAGPAMITMATHGRTGLSRFSIGSVAVGVTRWAKGPVLVRHKFSG